MTEYARPEEKVPDGEPDAQENFGPSVRMLDQKNASAAFRRSQ